MINMKNCTFKILISFLLLMIFSITGCNQPEKPNQGGVDNKPAVDQNEPKKEDDTPKDEMNQKLGDYFPLTLGSTWYYLGEGNEYATFNREIIFAEGNRAQSKEDNGGTVSSSVFQITEKAVTRIYFQGESYENENFLNAAPNDNLIILTTPLLIGTKWETSDSTREIVDLTASLNTPAGQFNNLLKIKITHPDSTMFEYYQAGVGMVKREFISGDFKVTSTLEKYEIREP